MPLIRVEFVVDPERVFLVTARLHSPQKPSFQISLLSGSVSKLSWEHLEGHRVISSWNFKGVTLTI